VTHLTYLALNSVPETSLNLSDTTTKNVSTAKHGLAPKLPNDATKYLDGTGAYSTPSGTTSPTLTTKGDLLTRSASAEVRHAAGADGDCLMAVAAQTDNLLWGNPWYSRQWMFHNAQVGNVFNTAIGQSAPAGTGSSVDGTDADGVWVDFATSGSSGNAVGEVSAAGAVRQRRHTPIIAFTMKTGTDISSIRYWLGLFSADPTAAADPAGVHLMGFRYDTGSDGTAFWRCCTKDGTTMNATTSTIAIALSTRYDLVIDARDQSNVYFYINGVLAATNSSNLPTSSTALNWRVNVTTLTASARHMLYSKTWLSYR
jgi:hypothetical protein